MSDTDQPASLVETHSAVVFFYGDRVLKVKKAVDLGFLDFSSLAARRIACEREVTLNRRLSPDVYLGVSQVLGPDGEVCDYLVTMLRMPDDRRLGACITRGEPVRPDLSDIARQMAGLHATESTPELLDVADRDSVRSHWSDGFAQLAPHQGGLIDPVIEMRIESLALRYLDGRKALFDERIAEGSVRDGHGDLQCQDIFLLPDGPRILDCLEFDDNLRWGDVLLDVGFLAMDLERFGHVELAQQFLDDYRAISGRQWPTSLAHHYLAYRAHVRAKVGVLRAAQQHLPAAPSEVEVLQQLCLDHLEAGAVRMIIVGGLPGTGKSTVAAALGKAVGAVVLRTDEIRRRIPDPDRYSNHAIDVTYTEMLSEAEALLLRGEQVILDATWSDGAHRDMARITADRSGADIIEINCVAPSDVCRARILRRMTEGSDVSEATPEVADDMARRFARWPQAIEIETDRTITESLRSALAACGWSGSPLAA
ncbi:MAG: AAA family ATPase [Microthrixaceae bacterium]